MSRWTIKKSHPIWTQKKWVVEKQGMQPAEDACGHKLPAHDAIINQCRDSLKEGYDIMITWERGIG